SIQGIEHLVPQRLRVFTALRQYPNHRIGGSTEMLDHRAFIATLLQNIAQLVQIQRLLAADLHGGTAGKVHPEVETTGGNQQDGTQHQYHRDHEKLAAILEHVDVDIDIHGSLLKCSSEWGVYGRGAHRSFPEWRVNR